MRNDFYVYEWIRLDTNEPFYVGKGIENRAYNFCRNKYFSDIINEVGFDNVAVNFLHKNITEQAALQYEIYYIDLYRYKFGFDLANMTAGGDGGRPQDRKPKKIEVILLNEPNYKRAAEALIRLYDKTAGKEEV